jgi:hypothetical protein
MQKSEQVLVPKAFMQNPPRLNQNVKKVFECLLQKKKNIYIYIQHKFPTHPKFPEQFWNTEEILCSTRPKVIATFTHRYTKKIVFLLNSKTPFA